MSGPTVVTVISLLTAVVGILALGYKIGSDRAWRKAHELYGPSSKTARPQEFAETLDSLEAWSRDMAKKEQGQYTDAGSHGLDDVPLDGPEQKDVGGKIGADLIVVAGRSAGGRHEPQGS